MAKSKTVWGVDVGQCALKAVKLSYDAKDDKAVLEAFDFVEHPKILSQPDAEPEELVRSALQQFLSRNDVEDQTMYLSVPGQAGLARVVKLPPVESKKVADIVKFEANQQIPFKLDDVSWDYQVLGSGEVTEGYVVDAEVGIFAIKKENVARYLAPLERFGIEVDTVQLAPVALYNFAAYDQFLHASQKIESPSSVAAPGDEAAPAAEDEGDTVVILDIGADNTDLVVTNGDSIWMRNLPIGGNHFTRSLTKELKLTFAKAEHMKRNATKAPDPKKLYQAMRPVFQDFANELQRSLGFFSSTNRQRTIRKIIGVGNGFKLPGLQKFLQQHLQYPVDKVQGFHGLRGDSLAEPVFMENVSSFCVAYGLALQGLKQTPVQTNLLPQQIRMQRMIRDKKPWTLTAAAAVLLGFGAMFLGSYNALSAVKNPSLEGPKQNADRAVTDFRKLQSDYDAAKGEYKKSFEETQGNIGFRAAEKRLQWIQALKWLNDAVPGRGNIEGEELPKIKEVNIETVQGAFLTNTGDWYNAAFQGDLGAQAKTTLTDDDQKAGPSGEGWAFQMIGYTFNAENKKYVTESILAELQKKRFRDRGFTHACIYWYDREPRWSPKMGSSGAKQSSIMEVLKVAYSPSITGEGAKGGGGGGRGGRGGDGTSGGLVGAGTEGGGGLSGGGLSGAGAGREGSGAGGAGMGMPGYGVGNSGPSTPGRQGSGAGMSYGPGYGGVGMESSGGGGGRGGRGARGGRGDGTSAGALGGSEGMDDLLPPGFMDEPSGGAAGKALEKTIQRTDFEIHVVFTAKKPDEKKPDAK